MLVSEASFDGGKASVITFCNEFCKGITAELNSERTLDLINYCYNYEGHVSGFYLLYLLKKVKTNVLPNDSVKDYSSISVIYCFIINEVTIRAATDLTSHKILK